MLAVLLCVFGVCLLLMLRLSEPYRVKAPQFLSCQRSCQRYLFRILWKEGFYPEVAYKVGQYELDLAFPYSQIAIECGWNDWEWTDIERARSIKKEKILKELGWQIVHLSPKEIYGNPRGCIEKIEQCVFKVKHIF